MLDVVVEGLPILLRFGLEKFGTIRCVVGHITASGRLGVGTGVIRGIANPTVKAFLQNGCECWVSSFVLTLIS